MLKVKLAEHHSMVWESQEINFVNLLENGKLLLKLMLMLKLKMVISSDYSVLDLQPNNTVKLLKQLMLKEVNNKKLETK